MVYSRVAPSTVEISAQSMIEARTAQTATSPDVQGIGTIGYVLRAIVLVLAWAILVLLVVAAGDIAVQSSTVAAFDRQITSTVVSHRSPDLNVMMEAVTWLGSWVALVPAAALLVILAVRRRVPVGGVALAALAWCGESSGISLAKWLVERQRPPTHIWLVSAQGWSWPSGHTGQATILFAVLAITTFYLTASWLLRVTAWIAAVTAVGAVGFSRIELGVHWTTDVIASVVFVSLWLPILLAFSASTFPAPEPGHPDSPDIPSPLTAAPVLQADALLPMAAISARQPPS
jgi:undecaprenyl-diphosphatase